MADDTERRVDEAEKHADETRKRAEEAATREAGEATPAEEYGGEAPEQDQPEETPPARQ